MSTHLTHRVPYRAPKLSDEDKANAARIRKARERAKTRLAELDAEMNAEVVRLRESGVALRSIADAFGLNHQTVQNIVNRAAGK